MSSRVSLGTMRCLLFFCTVWAWLVVIPAHAMPNGSHKKVPKATVKRLVKDIYQWTLPHDNDERVLVLAADSASKAWRNGTLIYDGPKDRAERWILQEIATMGTLDPGRRWRPFREFRSEVMQELDSRSSKKTPEQMLAGMVLVADLLEHFRKLLGERMILLERVTAAIDDAGINQARKFARQIVLENADPALLYDVAGQSQEP